MDVPESVVSGDRWYMKMEGREEMVLECVEGEYIVQRGLRERLPVNVANKGFLNAQ